MLLSGFYVFLCFNFVFPIKPVIPADVQYFKMNNNCSNLSIDIEQLGPNQDNQIINN